VAPGPGYGSCLRVVETKPGMGTGESRYRTADGRWWRECPATVTDSTLGQEVRYLHGDHLCNRP
jgi:hypothetical protein